MLRGWWVGRKERKELRRGSAGDEPVRGRSGLALSETHDIVVGPKRTRERDMC